MSPAPDLIAVYSRRKAPNVVALVAQLRALGGEARLWALDEVAPELAAWTVDVGPGGRCELLNRLYKDVPPERDLVISDDDVAFHRGDLARFLEISREGGWDLTQPTQPWRGSYASYPFSRRRPWNVARETTFVEVGPMLFMPAASRDRFLPLPDWGMGWGVELLWHDEAKAGARLAMIDDVTIRHLSPLFASYGREEEEARLRALLDERGVERVWDIQRTVRSIRRR